MIDFDPNTIDARVHYNNGLDDALKALERHRDNLHSFIDEMKILARQVSNDPTVPQEFTTYGYLMMLIDTLKKEIEKDRLEVPDGTN